MYNIKKRRFNKETSIVLLSSSGLRTLLSSNTGSYSFLIGLNIISGKYCFDLEITMKIFRLILKAFFIILDSLKSL